MSNREEKLYQQFYHCKNCDHKFDVVAEKNFKVPCPNDETCKQWIPLKPKEQVEVSNSNHYYQTGENTNKK